jgi:hypothetical protein
MRASSDTGPVAPSFHFFATCQPSAISRQEEKKVFKEHNDSIIELTCLTTFCVQEQLCSLFSVASVASCYKKDAISSGRNATAS